MEKPKPDKGQNGRLFYGWIVVISGMLVLAVTHGLIQNCFSMFIIPVCDDIKASRSGFSACQLITNMTYVLIGLFASRAFGKASMKKLMCAAAIVISAAYCGYSRCCRLWEFYALSAVIGCADVFITFIPFTIIIDNWFYEKRGLAAGLCFMGTGLGGMALTSLGSRWMLAFGWSQVFLNMGLIMAAVTVPLCFFVIETSPEAKNLMPLGGKPEEETPSDGQAAANDAPGDVFAQTAGTKKFYMLMALVVALGYIAASCGGFIIPDLTDKGFSQIYAANVRAVQLGLMTACKLLMGAMYDRWGAKKTTCIAAAVLFAGALSMLFGKYRIFHAFIVAGASFGGPVSNVGIPGLVRSTFGKKDYAVFSSWANSASFLGLSLGPYVGNLIFDKTGSYNLDFVLIMALSLFCFAIVKALRMDYAGNVKEA